MQHVDVLIIGAGLAGCSAGEVLLNHNISTQIVEKSSSIGGRLANKRFGGACFDSGAQFFTARDDEFKDFINDCINGNTVEEWYSHFPGSKDRYSRYRGIPLMNTLAKKLSKNLQIKLKKTVIRLTEKQGFWFTHLSDNTQIRSKALILTAPAPQTLDLIQRSNIQIDSSISNILASISYESCFAIMAILKDPSTLPPPGAISCNGQLINWISDNQQKGISKIPSITIHANLDLDEKINFEDKTLEKSILNEAEKHAGTKIINYRSHFWRYSKPKITYKHRCLVGNQKTSLPPLFIAGDAMGGPRVEGAFLSGRSAAELVIKYFN